MYLTRAQFAQNPLNSQTDKSDFLGDPLSLLSLRRVFRLHVTLEHMPTGRNVLPEREHISLDKAEWKTFSNHKEIIIG